ncbi:MAG: c-type cytochrome biogenesis protein CcmI [Pseudomonadota bacterium]
MTFWIVAAALCVAVALWMWRAVLRANAEELRPTAAYDLDLYRDQMSELDRDVARGLIGQAEAARARLEISRRILDADRALQHNTRRSPGGLVPIAFLLAITTVLALAIYAVIGAPGHPDLPLGPRIAAIEAARAERPDQAEAEAGSPAFPPVVPTEAQQDTLDAMRQRAEMQPDETETWFALARAEAQLRNYIPARVAQEHAIGLMGPRANARAFVDLARMQILAASGYVSPEAEAALNQALALDPQNGDARFLLGAMYQRQERPDLAFAMWRELLADSPADAPWVIPIWEEIEEVALFAGQRIDFSPPTVPRGPSEADFAAAAELSPEERMAMVEAMVAGLAERLANEGGPVEEWARLIGAYAVLGRAEEAQTILTEARAQFAGDLRAATLLDQAAAGLPAAP